MNHTEYRAKNNNPNLTDTNEIATTETKYQTDFYAAVKYQYLINFYGDSTHRNDKIHRNYQYIWDRDTKYQFRIGIFLVNQIFGCINNVVISPRFLLEGLPRPG